MASESTTPTELHEEALRLHRAGRSAEAEAAYRKVLEQEPDRADVHGQLAVLAIEKGAFDAAEAFARKATELDPADAGCWNNLGTVKACQGDLPAAAEMWRKALAIEPDGADLHGNLGKALRGLGMDAEARIHLARSLELAPGRGSAALDLAGLLMAEGKPEEAAELLAKHAGAEPEAWIALGGLQLRRGLLPEAEAAYRLALRLAPQNARAHLALAELFLAAGAPAEAFDAAERVLYAHPEHPGAYAALGRALQALGRVEEAVDANASAANLDINNANLHHRLLALLRRDPRQSEASLAEAHVRWGRLAGASAVGLSEPAKPTDRSPDRRLKVGYLSSDFGRTPGSRVLAALLGAHDRAQVEVFGYSDLARPDDTTEALASQCDTFRNLTGLSNPQAAAAIRQDGIDVLVDMAGHLPGGRVAALALAPAPVQVAAPGYGCTHGLTAITHRLTDEAADPLGAESYGPESILRLDRPAFAYKPFEEAPEPGPLPALANRFLTFGYFGPLDRLHDGVLEAWALLLAKVSGSRLSLPALPADPRTKSMWLARLESAGLDPDRLGYRPAPESLAQHLAAYTRVDVALAEFPHPTAASICEALWMGLPVLGLERRTQAFRPGLGVLAPLGFADWMPDNAGAMAAQGVILATDAAALSRLRADLRGRLQASPLLDGPGFARALESAYRTLWVSALS
ncbi:MAG: tetratricopeptide repeat protein [Holophagaceae bacterium]|nr:tetratricopeptide repeat protein [Holophagaceae bacterium]